MADAGIAEGNADLDQGFFPARWDRTTPGERHYLRAVVENGGSTASTAAIAEYVGVGPAALSPTRQSLIEKGILYAERRGFVSFTVPNMEAFITRQTDPDEADEWVDSPRRRPDLRPMTSRKRGRGPELAGRATG